MINLIFIFFIYFFYGGGEEKQEWEIYKMTEQTINMKKEVLKGVVCALVVAIAVILMTGNVLAYKLYCLNYGESLPDPENPRYTCFHDTCQVCTTDLDNPTHPGRCNSISVCQGLDGTVGGGGGGTIDAEAPEFTVNSPTEGGVYSNRRVVFDIETNEPSTFTYTDNINGRGRIKNMARNVFSYLRALSFKDGLNDITIFANDRFGNTGEMRVTFFVDSKAPRISRTLPKKGFANGDFEVQFKEQNPERLTLVYGNDETGYRESVVDIDTCRIDRGRYYCSISVDLDEYDGQILLYYFELEDISGKGTESRPVDLSVDITAPVLLNPDTFWYQGEGRNSKYIYFDMEIDEDNFDEITFIDNEARRPREKRICSRLRDDKCIKRVSFRTGHHTLDVQIVDDAGNAVSTERIVFDV